MKIIHTPPRSMRDLLAMLPKRPKGLDWYEKAHVLAAGIARESCQDIGTVAAVISILSPAVMWERCVKEARAMMLGDDTLRPSTYSKNAEKALKVRNHQMMPDEAMPFGDCPKTHSFWQNIVNPWGSEFVTVDRHAYRIATGSPVEKFNLTQYRAVADHYRHCASKVGLLPHQLQAALWEEYRNDKK